MKRREFLKTSLQATALGTLGTAALSRPAQGAEGRVAQEYYELRAYHMANPEGGALLEDYLEKAAIPALNRIGCRPVGVFRQQERQTPPASTELREPATIFVLIPYPNLETFAQANARLRRDEEHQRAGQAYLQRSKANAAFERINSWLMLAFAGMPRVELPEYSREKKPRFFELRTYESYSEEKAQNKVDMFNSGEIPTMQEVGLGPIFFGQGLVGANLPHLTYMLSAEDEQSHKKHWDAFGKHPVWNKLKSEPQYADNVSKIYNRFLVPAPFSQI